MEHSKAQEVLHKCQLYFLRPACILGERRGRVAERTQVRKKIIRDIYKDLEKC